MKLSTKCLLTTFGAAAAVGRRMPYSGRSISESSALIKTPGLS